jgi:Ni/Fe-hydrogenase subunit HybB-like protein
MKILTTIKHELLTILPPTLFFFVSFCLLIMTNQLISREYHIPAVGFANAAIGALIVGKAVLIMDRFRVINRFPGKPLIYNVVWTTGIYFGATLLFRYLEHLVRFLSKFGNIAEAHRQVMESIVWPHFWLVQMWLLVLLFVYCTLRELVRAVGKRELTALFFGLPDKAKP